MGSPSVVDDARVSFWLKHLKTPKQKSPHDPVVFDQKNAKEHTTSHTPKTFCCLYEVKHQTTTQEKNHYYLTTK
jgi:hypothetical protein